MGATSNHHGLYIQGDTRATMAGTDGSEFARTSGSSKAGPSSDCSLQLDYTKSESLVKGHQQRSLEYVPGPCTHRPSHHGSRRHPKPPRQPAREAGVQVGFDDWDEVVTR